MPNKNLRPVVGLGGGVRLSELREASNLLERS